MPDRRSAIWPWPEARRPASTCAWVRFEGRSLPMTPEKMMSVALPRMRGPRTEVVTLTMARPMTRIDDGRLGPQATEQPEEGAAEVLGLLGGHAHHAALPAVGAAATGPPGAAADARRGSAGSTATHAVWSAHAACASAAVSWEKTISRYVSHVSSSSWWRPTPTTRPSSMTTIWSAVHDRADALGHDEDRGGRQFVVQGGAQLRIRPEVEGGEAVVEDVDRGALDQRAGDGEALPLAAGDVRAALVDRRLQLALHLGDEGLALGDLEGVPERLIVGGLVAVAEVAGDRAAEEEGPLGDDPDALPEVLARHLADVHAVHQQRPAGHVVEARDQVDQRGLAAAGRAHDGGRLAGLGGERDVVQHRLLRAGVAELDVAELDRAGDRRAGRARAVAVRGHDGRHGHRLQGVLDARLDGQDLLDPVGRDGGPGHQDEHEDGHQDGHQDLHQVGQEGGQVADGHAARVDPDGAEPHHGDRRQVEDGHHRRDGHGEQPVDPDRGVEEVAVGRLEAHLLVAACARRRG